MSGSQPGSPRFARGLWAAAVVFTVYAATIPFSFVFNAQHVAERWAAAQERSLLSGTVDFSKGDLLQNVLLFVPFGMLAVFALPRARAFAAFTVAVISAALLSTACELLQLLTDDRLSSIWDLFANAAGAMVGAGLALVLTPLGTRALAAVPRSLEARRPVVVLASATALIVIAACEPFDLTLDAGTVWTKLKTVLTGSLLSPQPSADEWLTTFRFALFTYALTTWARRHTTVRSTPVLAAVVGVLMGAALEATQFLIEPRSSSGRDVLAAGFGSVIGAIAGPPIVRAVPSWVLVSVATVAAAVPFYLEPFAFAPEYRGIALMPFLAYYQFTSLQTVSHVVELMLIYAPVGFAVVWSGLSAGRAVAIVAAIAVSLEGAQGWVDGRYADITDIAMALLGGMVGAEWARRGSGSTYAQPMR